MFDILYTRTFVIVGFMLIITTLTSFINKEFETSFEVWFNIALSFILLFAIMFFKNSFPLNLVFLALFSGVTGWMIGPSISFYSQKEYGNTVTLALLTTSITVLVTALIGILSGYDFSFLGIILFISLLVLVIISSLNIFFFKSELVDLIKSYFAVVIFTFYLLYDFNRLSKLVNDKTWGVAVNISLSIYLDIINLFLNLLKILADSKSR